jgi:hypothetical protein
VLGSRRSFDIMHGHNTVGSNMAAVAVQLGRGPAQVNCCCAALLYLMRNLQSAQPTMSATCPDACMHCCVHEE